MTGTTSPRGVSQAKAMWTSACRCTVSPMSSAFRSGTASRAWMVQKTTRSPMLIPAVSAETLSRWRTASRGPALAELCSVY